MVSKKQDDWFTGAVADMATEVDEIKAEAEYDDWEPEEGDILQAVFLKAVPKPTQYGPGYLLIVKDLDKNENVKVWCGRKSLKEGIVDAAPAQGKLLAIQYVGLIPIADGSRNFNLYTVRAEAEDRELWDALQDEAARKQLEFDDNKPAVTVADEDLENPF